ncbi:hypothetical protein EV363DRAFT_487170 [Boletus edulis]|nr:hypothetical protein EV363DRAFT_487170 [Boletus edulis]
MALWQEKLSCEPGDLCRGYSSLAVSGFLSSLLSYSLSHSDRSRCASVYVWFCSILVSISLYIRLAHVFPHLRNM